MIHCPENVLEKKKGNRGEIKEEKKEERSKKRRMKISECREDKGRRKKEK